MQTLFWDASSPGVLDVLAYAGGLTADESALLAQDVVDVFADISNR